MILRVRSRATEVTVVPVVVQRVTAGVFCRFVMEFMPTIEWLFLVVTRRGRVVRAVRKAELMPSCTAPL